jgi:hypothetical protein
MIPLRGRPGKSNQFLDIIFADSLEGNLFAGGIKDPTMQSPPTDGNPEGI